MQTRGRDESWDWEWLEIPFEALDVFDVLAELGGMLLEGLGDILGGLS